MEMTTYKKFTLDIESKPQENLIDVCKNNIKVPKTYKDEEKIQAYIDEKWEKINQEKEKSMRWMNALNNATLLVANGKIEFKDLKHHANLIYQMRPLDTQEPKTNIYDKEPVKAEDLGEVMEDEINVDSIPF